MLYVKVVPISGRELIRRLQQLGWTIKSQRGSHVKLVKAEKMVIVPVHGNQDLGKGLLKKIEKQAGEQVL